MTPPLQPVICIVDDDADIRESLHFFFEEVGYEVEEAQDGAAVLTLLRTDIHPRVVLLDRMMPRLDGEQTLHRFVDEPAEIRHHTIIIYMSARDDPSDSEAAEFIQRHTAATVHKPFNLDVLRATVEQASRQLAERMENG